MTRTTCRRAWRRLDRACARALPGFGRRPDELSQALAAFSGALRCHRRLARLAPRFFDPAVVDREVRERAEKRQRHDALEPLLARVYGAEPKPYDPAPDLPPLPGPRTQRAVERALAELDLWVSAGSCAIELYRRRRPHAIPSPSRLARLLRLASALGRFSSGSSTSSGVRHPASGLMVSSQ